ncbi:hypothetical protein FRB93_002419 [Tulasnella sp. JGI-2019a]|nr:hypothetical protein FRB93_002419 [Tulasnella sp. JGI-2019a]
MRVFTLVITLFTLATVVDCKDRSESELLENIDTLLSISVPESSIRYTYYHAIADIIGEQFSVGEPLTDKDVADALKGLPPATQTLLKSELMEER